MLRGPENPSSLELIMKARVSFEKLIVIVLVALIALITARVPDRVLA